MQTAKTCSFLLFLLSLSTFQLQAETGHFNRTFVVSHPVQIEISSGAGNITVNTSSEDRVHIVAVIHARESSEWGGASALAKIHNLESNPPIERHGDNSLTIGKITDRDLQRNVSIDYEITVPAQTKLSSNTGSGDQSIEGLALPLVVKTGSGKITVENLSANVNINSGSGAVQAHTVKGELHAETGSGNIVATGVAGEVFAKSASGEVEIEQTAPGNVRVETASGNVKLRDVRGGMRVETASGNIYAEGHPSNDWHIGAVSGSVDLKVPSETNFNLDARTTSGTVGVKVPVSVEVSSPNHIQGKVGNGGVLIDLHTISGSILVN